MKYVTQTGTCPPYFTFFVNRPDLVTDNYERFLENRLREGFDLDGHAGEAEVQEEGLRGTMQDAAGCGRACSSRHSSWAPIPWGLHHLEGVLPHRPARARLAATSAPRTPCARWARPGGCGGVSCSTSARGSLSGVPGAGGVSWLLVPGGGLAPECARLLRHLWWRVAFLGCVWGHIFSPWLGFKGGKGIAVAVGCLFVDVRLGRAPARSSRMFVVAGGGDAAACRIGSLAAAVACPFFALATTSGATGCARRAVHAGGG